MSDLVIGLVGLRQLYELIGALNHERSLDATLTRVVDGVIAGLLDFESVAEDGAEHVVRVTMGEVDSVTAEVGD